MWPACDKANLPISIGYLNPGKIQNQLFLIKRADDEGQTIETRVWINKW